MTKGPNTRKPAPPTDVATGWTARNWIYGAGTVLGVAAIGALLYESGLIPGLPMPERPAETAAVDEGFFEPPSRESIPEGPFGEAIRRGEAIFMNTATNASDHVGNGLSCSNCHLDGGREPYSAPMWAAWGQYPTYRAKNDQINTMEDRVQGCFTFSMNAQHSVTGEPPPLGDDIYRDLQSYFFWLASGAPNNEDMTGAGFGRVEKTELGYSPERGEEVFAQNCAVCHSADGQGQADANGRIVFPPLWGPNSYNWGAGMARVNTAAAFIKNNMPLSQPGTLTDQEAWDVAAYIDSFERPKDPRQGDMTIEETRRMFHDGDDIYYGQILDGVLLGVGTPDPERPVGAPDPEERAETVDPSAPVVLDSVPLEDAAGGEQAPIPASPSPAQ